MSMKATVLVAYQELFPDGPPEAMRVKECYRTLREFLKEKGNSQSISDKSFQRFGIGKKG
jgi:hypothetical protein